jgi:hypothetical protein
MHEEYFKAYQNELIYHVSRDTSVGLASCYGLDDRDSRVRLPVGARNFSHHSVQNGSRAQPVSYPMGIGISFPGVKAAGA